MKKKSSGSAQVEEARIQTAYAKREGNIFYSWLDPSLVFLTQERERRILFVLKQLGFSSLNTIKILEIGCGTGFWLREFVKWGFEPEHITGIDLLPERVKLARHLCPQNVQIECGSASKLGFPDRSFDVVFQSTVFSSVLDPTMRQQIAGEMLRVVKSDGALLWYDFHVNNPKNPDVQGMNKREIERLFPECRIDLRRITLAPPLSRFLAPFSILTCYLLERCKVLNTHYLGVIRMV